LVILLHVVAPEQRISVDDALRGVTIEAAYSWRMENELGSLAPGKIAEIIKQNRESADQLASVAQ